MLKAFRAVPLTDIASRKDAVSVMAETALAALLKAKAMLGDELPFDLLEGGQLVVSYRPARTLAPVRLSVRSTG